MMGIIRAGDLDRRVTIQEKVISGQIGVEAPVWKDIATAQARKLDVTGRERIMGVTEIAKGTSIFRMRYRTGISEANRLILDGVIHDIEHMAEIGRREGWDITTSSKGEKV